MSRFFLMLGIGLGVALTVSAGGYLYLRWGRSVDLLSVDVKGDASVRPARMTQWRPASGTVWLGDKDSIVVTAKALVTVHGHEPLKPGVYQVNRVADGGLGLVPTTTEAFDWAPKPAPRGLAELRAGEAELGALRSLVEKRRPLKLQGTRELVPMKGIELSFADFDLKLLEPPEGRRFSPEGDIHLHWTPLPFDELTYQVDLAKSSKFESTVPRLARTNRLSIHLPERGLYYWRVTAARRGARLRSITSTFLVK